MKGTSTFFIPENIRKPLLTAPRLDTQFYIHVVHDVLLMFMWGRNDTSSWLRFSPMYRKALRLRPATTLGKKWWWFTCKAQYWHTHTHNLHWLNAPCRGKSAWNKQLNSTQASAGLQYPTNIKESPIPISLQSSSPKLVNQSLWR